MSLVTKIDCQKGCSDFKKSTIVTGMLHSSHLTFCFADDRTALENARDMLDGIKDWSGSKTRDSYSLQYWIGNDWRSFEDRMRDNIYHASNFTISNDYHNYMLMLSCYDPNDICQKYNSARKQAGGFAWTTGFYIWKLGHITFCDPFFSLQDESGKREELQDGYRRDPDYLKDMSNYNTLGQFFIHELFHLESTWTGHPNITDQELDIGSTRTIRAYGPVNCRKLAKQQPGTGDTTNRGATVTTVNADSYAMFINAVYWWQNTGEFPHAPNLPPDASSPPLMIMPHLDLSEGDVSDESLEAQLEEVFKDYLAAEDVSDQSIPFDLPSTDVNACHGVSGDYWINNPALATENILTFCGQSNKLVVYNEGTLDELWLSITNFNDDSAGPNDSPDCYIRFGGNVIDGCDGNDPINNPHNHKFGSNYFTADGWEYAMHPLNEKINEVTCEVRYMTGYRDRFEIRGKNLPDGLLGANHRV